MISQIYFSELLNNSWLMARLQAVHVEAAQAKQHEGG